MRAGWFPVHYDVWNELIQYLQKPWTREQMLTDMRYHQHQGEIPGRVVLQKRWGTTNYRAREVMRSELDWFDPNADRPSADRPPTVRRPSTVRADTDETGTSGDNRPPTDRPPTVDRPSTATRVSIKNKEHNIDKDKDTLLAVATVSELDQLVTHYRVHWPRRLRGGKPIKGMKARLTEHGLQKLKLMITWAADSGHKRAVYLRENNNTSDTLFRATNCQTYVEFASGEHQTAPRVSEFAGMAARRNAEADRKFIDVEFTVESTEEATNGQ